MKSWTRHRWLLAGTVGLLGLLVTSVAWASPSFSGALDYSGLWSPLLIAIVLVLEVLALRLLLRFSWGASSLTALLASLVSSALAGGMARGPLGLRDVLTLLGVSLALEAPVVLIAAWIVRRRARPDRPQPRTGLGWALLAAVAMNVVTAPVLPAFQYCLPSGMFGTRSVVCLSHLKQLALAARMYQDEHQAWPPAHNLAELTPLLAPYLGDPELWDCPGQLQGAFFPLPGPPLPYACADFTKLPADPFDAHAAEIPIFWDSAPVHNHGYDVAYMDGHVQWSQVIPPAPAP